MLALTSLRARLISGLLAVAILLASVLAIQPAAANENQPTATYKNALSGILYPATALTGSGTTNTASPRTVGGRDFSFLPQFGVVDIFVSADHATTGTVTATVQFSNDATNWANCYRRVPETVAAGADSTVTENCTLVVTNDATGYISVPMQGQYIRLSMVRTDAVTPTVTIYAKNNAGQ